MITAALIGNPNSGKTTVFNKLTGSIQKTGNWPGVTVERKQGFIRNAPKDMILCVDLPGIYSLSPYTPEEVVSRDYLIGSAKEKPDVAINIVDASNLERSLYLVSQVADMGIPMVVILNMIDVAEKEGMKISAEGLSEALGCEVVETIGTKSQGTNNIAAAVQRAYESGKPPKKITYGADIEATIEGIIPLLSETIRDDLQRWVAIKIIEGDQMVEADMDENVLKAAKDIVKELEEKLDDDGVQIVATARYAAGAEIQKQAVTKPKQVNAGTSLSDKIDRILLNRVLAIPIFLIVMYVVYWVVVEKIGTWGSDYINDGFVLWVQQGLGKALLSAGVEPMIHDLIISGIVGGVGAVLGFLPLIIVLFFLLALLEECGYMVRVAYMLDRVFCWFGISGKAVIPAIVGIGCSVPAIMGTRTIEDESNRNVSVICNSFVPCGAKLPIITVIIAAFFGGSALLTLSLYVLGIVMILISGLFLKKFSGFIGKPSPFLMELPVYHAPMPRNVLTSVTEKSWAFVRKAGTLILLSAVIIWVLSSFNWSFTYLGDGATTDSILASIGKALCWIFMPLGFGTTETWELTVASITGLMAKENLLATLAVLIGAVTDADDLPTKAAMAKYLAGVAHPAATAMSFLLFNLICAPCFAAIGAMKRELMTWRRTLMGIFYQCATAYGVAGIYYNLSCILAGDFNLGILWMILFIAVPVYVIVMKDPLAPVRKFLSQKETAAVQ